MKELYQRDGPINVFYSYAQEDKELREQLEKHLSLLRRQGIIIEWHDYQIEPGTNWSQVIDQHLRTSSLILLLVSSDFLASDYCFSFEMQSALERHADGSARVIPVILRPVDLQGAPFAQLPCLPQNALPVTAWTNRDAAFLDVARGIRTAITEIQKGTFASSRLSSPLINVQQSSITRESKNRLRLLQRVRTTWITDVLEPSLHNANLIMANLRIQPDAVINRWLPIAQEVIQPARMLPPATSITDVYNNAQGELLILGEPGTGKTTLLLELTHDLLNRAEQDGNNALPIVFKLSSWVEKRLPLSMWLVEELEMKYEVKRAIGANWLREDQITLLLDRLDEIPAPHQAKCINAINAYRREHPLVSVVVCSRMTEYQISRTLLALYTAVEVQTLTFPQIEDYLARLGKQGAGLNKALRDDPSLQDLAKTPLILSILLRSFQEKPPDPLLVSDAPEVWLRQIFQEYIHRMLSRGGMERRYASEQTIRWLTWLAEQMRQRHQTIFYIEQIQPYFLPDRQSQCVYKLLAIHLPDILIGICVSIGIFTLFFSGVPSVPYLLIYGLFGGLVGSLLSREGRARERSENQTTIRGNRWSKLFNLRHLRNGLLLGLSFGFSYGLSFGPQFGFSYGLVYSFIAYILSFLLESKQDIQLPISISDWSVTNLWYKLIKFGYLRRGLTCGFCFGLGYAISTEVVHQFHITQIYVGAYVLACIFNYTLIGILLCIIFEKRKKEVQLAEIINWSWTKFFYQLVNIRHVSNSVFIGLLTVFVIGISSWLRVSSRFGLEFGLSTGLIFAFSYWIFFSLFTGLSSDTLEDRQRILPNQGIQRSVSNSILVSFTSVVVSWIICTSSYMVSHSAGYGVNAGLSYGLKVGFTVALVVGICTGIIVGLLSGGYASIQHYTLRWLLWRSGVIPWNYTRFLDYAHKRILLQKIGGGYTFVHNLLLDYFAS